MEPVEVSQSKVKLWRRCRQAYYYKHVEHLKRKRVSRPLQFGRMVHEMLEAHANGDDPFELLDKLGLENRKLFSAEREMYGEIVADIRTIMTAYFERYPDSSLRYVRVRGRSAEHEFRVPLEGNIFVVGKIDTLGRTKDKRTWLVENKTFKRMPSEDERWRNLQSAVYLWAMRCGKFPRVDGVLWNYIRSKPPTRPQVLKNGSLSSRSCDTLPATVMAVIKEHGLREKDYPDLIETARRNQDNYFRRIVAPINERVLQSLVADFRRTAREIALYRHDEPTRNIDRHCSWCDYEPLCRTTLTDGDVEFVRRREYDAQKAEAEEVAVGDEGEE